MASKRSNIIIRFGIVYILIALGFVAVIAKIIVIQTVERDNWLKLQGKGMKTDIIVKPKRGNIYSIDGRLMASSIPTYHIYIDTRAQALCEKEGKLFYQNVDSVALCLSHLFKDKSQQAYKTALTNAYNNRNGRFLIYPKRITYNQLKEVQAFPLFRLGRNKSGLFTEEYVQRVKPFGSLAARTIGDVYADESKGGRSGLEQFYNNTLTGKPGFSTRQKIANTWQETIEIEPIEGMDIVTTIDIDIQDISENALLNVLKKYNAKSGYVIMMETKTGEIKSIVNMYRSEPGYYYEKENGAVSDMMEPGSTFKTFVLMAALEEGKVSLTDTIDVGKGRLSYSGVEVTDHNANKGGYGKISVANVMHGSSNVGMHKIVYNAYGKSHTEQAELVDKLRAMKLTEPIQLEIRGAGTPYIKHPKENSDWSKTSLSALSRGYEIKMPPIYTLTHYNAIANDGKMIKPIFVKSINKDGQVVKSFKTETINSSICKSSTLKEIQEVLLGVVEGPMGTAKPARSNIIHIAGKTGTARVIDENGKYTNRHRVSFCGYFPAEKPQYTGIVVVTEPNVSSAGLTSGVVFKNIAERTMALKSEVRARDIEVDSIGQLNRLPKAKSGNYKALQTVMKNIRIPMTGESGEWVKTSIAEQETKIKPLEITDNKIPDVKGMGAKDAVYLLESLGLNVQIQGRGKVASQSINAGTEATKGRSITLHLQ